MPTNGSPLHPEKSRFFRSPTPYSNFWRLSLDVSPTSLSHSPSLTTTPYPLSITNQRSWSIFIKVTKFCISEQLPYVNLSVPNELEEEGEGKVSTDPSCLQCEQTKTVGDIHNIKHCGLDFSSWTVRLSVYRYSPFVVMAVQVRNRHSKILLDIVKLKLL